MRIDNLGLASSQIWADAGHPPVTDRLPADWRALVFDLGSVTRPRDRSIVAAGVVAHLWEQRRRRKPVLRVIDEAHNVCPQTPEDSSQALATEHLIAIAGEGRKSGIYLLLSTQRPQKVHSAGFGLGEGLAAGRIAPSPMLFRTGVRHTPEGGADIPTDWALPAEV